MARIEYNSVSEINSHEVIAQLKAGNEVCLNYGNKDILAVYFQQGTFAQLGAVECLTLSYGYFSVDHWVASQTEYFEPQDHETAALAFLKRATFEGHKATNTGKTLEQLARKDAASIHFDYMTKLDGGDISEDDPLDQASHALICGADDGEVESHCTHCREEWESCVCDGGTGSPFHD